jgi:uncharacterized protein
MDIFNQLVSTSSAQGNAILSAYVSRDMDVNAMDYKGKTVLCQAAAMGLYDGAIKLINAKANINAITKDGYTALHYAIGNSSQGNDYVEIAKLLVKAGADVNLGKSYGGRTALMSAIELGDIALLRLLLKAKADLSAKDDKGQTAIDYATQKGRQDIIDILNTTPKPWWKF